MHILYWYFSATKVGAWMCQYHIQILQDCYGGSEDQRDLNSVPLSKTYVTGPIRTHFTRLYILDTSWLSNNAICLHFAKLLWRNISFVFGSSDIWCIDFHLMYIAYCRVWARGLHISTPSQGLCVPYPHATHHGASNLPFHHTSRPQCWCLTFLQFFTVKSSIEGDFWRSIH